MSVDSFIGCMFISKMCYSCSDTFPFLSKRVQQLAPQTILYIVYGMCFCNIVIRRGLWPPSVLDLKMCDCYLWILLKDKVCSNNCCNEGDLVRKKTFRS